LQCERDDLLQSNEELALKLDEFQGIIHQKEQQFSSVVKEMREAQVAMQRALRSHSQTDLLQQEVVRSKQIQVRLAEFKTQA
jgi:cellobiose-specific phosphotransferase system component IIA